MKRERSQSNAIGAQGHTTEVNALSHQYGAQCATPTHTILKHVDLMQETAGQDNTKQQRPHPSPAGVKAEPQLRGKGGELTDHHHRHLPQALKTKEKRDERKRKRKEEQEAKKRKRRKRRRTRKMSDRDRE